MDRLPIAKIDWSSGQWGSNERRYVGSVVEPAIVKAEDYLGNQLKIEPAAKRTLLYRGRRNFTRGGSISSDIVELYFTAPELGRRKLERISDEITATHIHENTHCIRAIEYSDLNLLEYVATEAVAHYAGVRADQDLFGIPTELTDLSLIGDEDGELLINALYNHPGLTEEIKPHFIRPRQLKKINPLSKGPKAKKLVLDDWFYDTSGDAFGWSQRLGLWCVNSWVENYGYDLSTIIKMPAREMIAL